MKIRVIATGTPEYEAMIALRMRVLLDPIGIPRTYINPPAEAADVLVAAFENGQLVGCCVLTPRSETTVQLRQMAVDESRQKKGVGAAIVGFAEREAAARGFQTLVLHARDGVVPFYQKCGYRICGEQFFEVGIPHHAMEKTLHETA